MNTDGPGYVLSSGAWYEVSIDFVQNVTDSIAKVAPPPFALTAWNGADSEGEYNKACSGNHGFLNCDAKNIFFGGGRSQLEFCDMYPNTKLDVRENRFEVEWNEPPDRAVATHIAFSARCLQAETINCSQPTIPS